MSRGVPRLPNRYLNQLCFFRQLDFARREIKSNGFLDILTRFSFGVSGGRAAGKLRTYSRVALRHWIVFEDDAEFHDFSI